MLQALIPYIVAPQKHFEDLPILGDQTIGVFGVIVAIGVLTGIQFGVKYAKVKNIDEMMARDQIFWSLVFAFIISHWVSVLFYFPDQVKEDPKVLLYIASGLSSVGGFFGAFIGMNWFLHRYRQPVLIYADMNIFSLVIGMVFGRLSCALVHDHPGKIVSAGEFLAVGPWPCRCPGGGRALPTCCDETQQIFRLDLGLIEFLFLGALAIFVYLIYDWKKAAPGKLCGIVSLSYGIVRFMLDYLRESTSGQGISVVDLRYLGLTTAQYFSIAFMAAGVWLLFLRKSKPSDLDYAKDDVRIAREQARVLEQASKTSSPQENKTEPPSEQDSEKPESSNSGN